MNLWYSQNIELHYSNVKIHSLQLCYFLMKSRNISKLFDIYVHDFD